MKTICQKLNNVSGQIEGVKRMVESEVDCVQVLIQLKAIRSAISGVMDQVVAGQFDRCIKKVTKKDKQLLINIKKYVEFS